MNHDSESKALTKKLHSKLFSVKISNRRYCMLLCGKAQLLYITPHELRKISGGLLVTIWPRFKLGEYKRGPREKKKKPTMTTKDLN